MSIEAKIINIALGIFLIACSAKLDSPQYISALNAYNEGRYQTALTFIDQAIRAEPEESEFYILRAKANYKLDNKANAMEDLNLSLNLGENSTAYHLKGKIFLERGELPDAKENLRKAYELNSASAELLFDLGYLEFMNGENQLALEYYLQAAKYDSRNPATYVNIGNLYAMMSNSKLAIDNYSKALVLDTTDGIAYYNRANEKMIINDLNGAIEDYKKSLEIDSLNINTMFMLAEVQSNTGDFLGALDNYNQIIKNDSASAKGFYFRGLSLLSLNDSKNACSDFKRAGELGYFEAYEMIKKHCDTKKKNQIKKDKKKSKP